MEQKTETEAGVIAIPTAVQKNRYRAPASTDVVLGM
jgi:hypothetical protein